MTPVLGRILIYTSRLKEMGAFYSTHFGYSVHPIPGDRMTELRPPGPGPTLLLHPLGARQKEGQVLVKLVFDVEDVAAFCARAAAAGLPFGKTHKGDGYSFANGKDPAGNSIAVSSRAFRPDPG